MKVVSTFAAAVVLAGGLTAGVSTVSANAAPDSPGGDVYGRHQGMRCHTKNKVIKVGHGNDRIRLKCKMGHWRGKHVLVWKFDGRV